MPCGIALKCAEQLGFITSMIVQLKLPMSAVQILRLFCITLLTDAKEHGYVLVDSNFSTIMRASRHSVLGYALCSNLEFRAF